MYFDSTIIINLQNLTVNLRLSFEVVVKPGNLGQFRGNEKRQMDKPPALKFRSCNRISIKLTQAELPLRHRLYADRS